MTSALDDLTRMGARVISAGEAMAITEGGIAIVILKDEAIKIEGQTINTSTTSIKVPKDGLSSLKTNGDKTIIAFSV